ncbi:MAG: aspartyl protease family protein [Gemmatimonadaceae bacterium]
MSTPAEIRLQYNDKLAAIGFPSPLLRGSIHGQMVWFIVDTGAGVHTLASWFVSAARIVSHTTKATTTGSTGVESTVRAAYGEMIHADRADDILLREAIVVDLPPIFEEQRIAGLLSPQLLAPANMAAILDLHVPQLSFGPPPPDSPGTRVCRNEDSQFTNRLYAATTSMGNVEAQMLVDTGATRSVAVPSSPVAVALSGRASVSGRTQGVGGTATTTRMAPDVALKFGGGQATVSLTIGGTPSKCARDGLLGMDALRECRLVLGQSSFGWSCRPRF